MPSLFLFAFQFLQEGHADDTRSASDGIMTSYVHPIQQQQRSALPFQHFKSKNAPKALPTLVAIRETFTALSPLIVTSQPLDQCTFAVLHRADTFQFVHSVSVCFGNESLSPAESSSTATITTSRSAVVVKPNDEDSSRLSLLLDLPDRCPRLEILDFTMFGTGYLSTTSSKMRFHEYLCRVIPRLRSLNTLRLGGCAMTRSSRDGISVDDGFPVPVTDDLLAVSLFRSVDSWPRCLTDIDLSWTDCCDATLAAIFSSTSAIAETLRKIDLASNGGKISREGGMRHVVGCATSDDNNESPPRRLVTFFPPPGERNFDADEDKDNGGGGPKRTGVLFSEQQHQKRSLTHLTVGRRGVPLLAARFGLSGKKVDLLDDIWLLQTLRVLHIVGGINVTGGDIIGVSRCQSLVELRLHECLGAIFDSADDWIQQNQQHQQLEQKNASAQQSQPKHMFGVLAEIPTLSRLEIVITSGGTSRCRNAMVTAGGLRLLADLPRFTHVSELVFDVFLSEDHFQEPLFGALAQMRSLRRVVIRNPERPPGSTNWPREFAACKSLLSALVLPRDKGVGRPIEVSARDMQIALAAVV